MPNLQLDNTAQQVKTTISEHYNRLVGSYVGPLTASDSVSAAFVIQNGNKGQGICVANNGTTFFNNNLNFDPANTNVVVNIPDTKNFIVTGNGAVMNFNGNGTLSIGQNIDTNYKGLQVFNSCPGITLKDSNAFAGSGCQFIRFIDSTGCDHTSITHCPTTICFAGESNTYNTLNIHTQCAFKISNNCKTFLTLRNDKVSFFAGDCTSNVYDFYVGSCAYLKSVNINEGATINGQITTYSSYFNQYAYGSCVGMYSANTYIGGTQFIDFASQDVLANQAAYIHTSIQSRRCPNGGSDLCFFTSSEGYFGQDRRALAMQICSNRKVAMQGDVCAYVACFTSTKTNSLCNLGGRTYLGSDAANIHWLATNNSLNNGISESVGGLGYGLVSNPRGCVTEHRWIYNNPEVQNVSTMCLNSTHGLSICHPISTCCRLTSSGSLNVSNINCCSCVSQRCISLFGYSITGPSISISGATCFSGNANFNCNVKAATICASDSSAINCIQGSLRVCELTVTNSALVIGFNSISTVNKICVGGLQSTQHPVCAQSFCQPQGVATINCFAEGLNVGVLCEKAVNSKNTAKAWGTICLRNGWALNNSEASLFHNVNFFGHSNLGNGIYGIVLNTPIKAPFSVSFSTRALSQFPWTTGSGVYDSNDGFSNNGIAPFTAHLLTCANNSTINATQLITANSFYNILYFTVTDNNLYQTNWSSAVHSIASNLPVLTNYSTTPQFASFSPATRINYLKGAIDFSIYSQ